jgi:hypothetical protein
MAIPTVRFEISTLQPRSEEVLPLPRAVDNSHDLGSGFDLSMHHIGPGFGKRDRASAANSACRASY